MDAPQAQTILLLSANPLDTQRLRTDNEIEKIKDGLKSAKYRDSFTIQAHNSVSATDFQQTFLEHEPNIVHFSGHGEGQEGIVLEDDHGNSNLIKASILADLFKLFGASIHCVLLNASYSEVQADAIAEYIDYVIGMKQAVSDQAAISFSVAFYQAIGAGKSIEFAFKHACVAIQMQKLPEHLTPVLKKRQPKAIAAAQILPASPTTATLEPEPDFQQFTVFLAEVPDDLQAQHQSLQHSLQQMNIRILPKQIYFFPPWAN